MVFSSNDNFFGGGYEWLPDFLNLVSSLITFVSPSFNYRMCLVHFFILPVHLCSLLVYLHFLSFFRVLLSKMMANEITGTKGVGGLCLKLQGHLLGGVADHRNSVAGKYVTVKR